MSKNIDNEDIINLLEQMMAQKADKTDETEFETIEADVEPKTKPKAKAKTTKKVIKKTKAKKIAKKAILELRPASEIDDDDELSLEDFEETCLQFVEDKAAFNAAKKAVDEGRPTILDILGDNDLFETERVVASISRAKSEKLDVGLVYDNLEAEELAELFQLGIVSLTKGAFENWAKNKGYDPKDFVIQFEPQKRLNVNKK